MTQIKQYCIIKEDDLGVLVAKTTDLLSNGWMVLGGVAVGSQEIREDSVVAPYNQPFYCQALVLPRTNLDARKEVHV